MLKNVMYTLSVLRVFLYSFSCTHLWTCGLKDPLTQTRRLTHATMANTGGQYMASSYSHLLIKMGIQSTSPSLTFSTIYRPTTDCITLISRKYHETILMLSSVQHLHRASVLCQSSQYNLKRMQAAGYKSKSYRDNRSTQPIKKLPVFRVIQWRNSIAGSVNSSGEVEWR